MTVIAYCGNFDPPHSTESHIRIALQNLGHEVRALPEQRQAWELLPMDVEGADLFLWTRTAGFDPPDIERQAASVKALEIPTASIHLDRWWGLNREGDIFRSPFFRTAFVFTADGGHDEQWKAAGINHHWSPPAILSDEAKRVGVFRPEYAADVGFVGNLRRYGHPEWGPYRYSLYKFLVRTYGKRFKLWEGGIRGQDLADLYASVKVLVGDSCLAGGAKFYWSDRSPECTGRGGFLIHPETEGYAEAFPFVPTYPLGDFDALGKVIDWYLDHDEERWDLASDSRSNTIATATYEHRLARLLEIVL